MTDKEKLTLEDYKSTGALLFGEILIASGYIGKTFTNGERLSFWELLTEIKDHKKVGIGAEYIPTFRGRVAALDYLVTIHVLKTETDNEKGTLYSRDYL